MKKPRFVFGIVGAVVFGFFPILVIFNSELNRLFAKPIMWVFSPADSLFNALLSLLGADRSNEGCLGLYFLIIPSYFAGIGFLIGNLSYFFLKKVKNQKFSHGGYASEDKK